MSEQKQAGGASLTERAMEILQWDILSGQLKPGSRLRVIDLAEGYGIGATPIREALCRLTSQNLVTTIDRRGFRVRDMSYTDLEDITRTRLIIEREGLRLSMAHGGDEWEASVVAAFHRLRLHVERHGLTFFEGGAESDLVHRQFHASLIAGCGSQRIMELAADLYYQAYRYRRIMMKTFTDPDRFVAGHERLSRVVLSRNEAEALSLLENHLYATLKSVYPEGPPEGVRTNGKQRLEASAAN